jgi:exoribonuclease-2
VRVKLGAIDEIALDVHGTVIERLDTEAEPAAADEDSGEEEPVAGPIAIAVDVSEEAPGADNPSP